MGMYAVQTADSSELAALGDAARNGRAAAVARRRALAAGRAAAASTAENGHGNGAGAPAPAASNGSNGSNDQGASNGGQGAPGGTAEATNGVAAAHLGRSLSVQRRRQLSQGKQALNGGGAPSAAENGHGNGAGAPPAASNGQGASSGGQGAPGGTAGATNGVAAAHLGRSLSVQRRRQLSQGKQALGGGGGAPSAAENGHGKEAPPAASGDGQGAGAAVATNGVAAAHLGRALSVQRRRQLSQGKQALTGGVAPAAAAADAVELPVPENLQVDGPGSGRERARARRAAASRVGSAELGRPERVGRVTHPPKVIVSPTHGGQRVTGQRVTGLGMSSSVKVTGGEPGAALPVSGTQYVAADGAAPAPAAGAKVGRVRTPKGLVVSGTTVRGTVPITGDEAGEHLPITGEADQKFDDDLTPRRDGAYRSAQFPRRADPKGATALGTRLAPPGRTTSGDGAWHPLENTDGGLAVTGTAVGRSGRVTGNEAGACRPITGAQYQHLSSYSSECAGVGGGTAPAAHLNRARLDPATGGKVSVAQTWSGQRVTGPNVEHSPNVTGDEPGSCRPLTGTPYQGPSSMFGWCDADDGEAAAQRIESRPQGVAVTGDLPMPAEGVTGTERGEGRSLTGTSYYGDMRPAEPAVDDWAAQAFPVAWARRLAGGEGGIVAPPDPDNPALPPSSVPGFITGAFAVGEGMVTGNNEFLFRPRAKRDGQKRVVTGEGRTEGRTITGSSAWASHDRVTGTEGYIAAGRNPSEGGSKPHGWAGALKFRNLATPGAPREKQNVTGQSGWNSKDAGRVTLSGGAQG